MPSDRSRSPLRKTVVSEKIAREVASFGRYPERRPHGLTVDAEGSMMLEDLMHTWGTKNDFGERDVLDAVRRHMLHEVAGIPSLRFSIDTDGRGYIFIRVMPRKVKNDQLALANTPATPHSPPLLVPNKNSVASPTPPPAALEQPKIKDAAGSQAAGSQALKSNETGIPGILLGKRKPRADGRRKPPVVVRTIRGSVLPHIVASFDSAAASSQPGKEVVATTSSATSAAAPMELVDLEADDSPSLHQQATNARLIQQTKNPRQVSIGSDVYGRHSHCASDNGGSSFGGRRRHDSCGRRWSIGESVQRWLGWALKKGYDELNLSVDVVGWADLQKLAQTMKKSRPDLGTFDGPRLKALIEETDHEGRFEICNGKLRKLDKEARPRRGYESACSELSTDKQRHLSCKPKEEINNDGPGQDAAMACAEDAREGARSEMPTEPIQQRPPRSSSISSDSQPRRPARSRSPLMVVDADASTRLQTGDKPTPGSRDQGPVASQGVAMQGSELQKPSPPPGPGWTQFLDHEGEESESMWWHYNGPLGSWWCETADAEIEPYEEES